MLASLSGQQWLMREDIIPAFALSALEATEKADQERADGYWSEFYDLRTPAYIDGDGIAHIEIRGALMNKAPKFYEKLGLATRYNTIIEETDVAVKQGAKGVVYHVDSPGGAVAGVQEAGQAIMDAGVPTIAHCHGLACSAAYWLSSGCGAIVATPSASVGNIGAILSWADCDKFWEDMGVTFKALVSEGADLKSTFHLEPNKDQVAFLQESIDEAGAAFRAHVAAGREKSGAQLSEEIWRAGWYSGEKAESLGLVQFLGSAQDAVDHLKSIIAG